MLWQALCRDMSSPNDMSPCHDTSSFLTRPGYPDITPGWGGAWLAIGTAQKDIVSSLLPYLVLSHLQPFAQATAGPGRCGSDPGCLPADPWRLGRAACPLGGSCCTFSLSHVSCRLSAGHPERVAVFLRSSASRSRTQAAGRSSADECGTSLGRVAASGVTRA